MRFETMINQKQLGQGKESVILSVRYAQRALGGRNPGHARTSYTANSRKFYS